MTGAATSIVGLGAISRTESCVWQRLASSAVNESVRQENNAPV